MRKVSVPIFLLAALLVFTVDLNAKKAAGFALFNKGGKLIRLSQLLKKENILLDFWASYCRPCITEMPQLVELEKKYGVKNNLRLVLINIDKEGKDKALPILEQLNINNECLFDIYQMTIKKFLKSPKVPALVLINRSGKIVFMGVGEKKNTLKRLEMYIKRLRK